MSVIETEKLLLKLLISSAQLPNKSQIGAVEHWSIPTASYSFAEGNITLVTVNANDSKVRRWILNVRLGMNKHWPQSGDVHQVVAGWAEAHPHLSAQTVRSVNLNAHIELRVDFLRRWNRRTHSDWSCISSTSDQIWK